MAADRPIRVGVALSSNDQSNWHVDLVHALANAAGVAVSVVHDSGRAAAPLPWLGDRIRRRYLSAHGRGVLGTARSKGLPAVDRSQGGPEVLRERLTREPVDVLLLLSGVDASELGTLAGLRVWRFAWARPGGWQGAPPGLVEHIAHVPVVHMALEQHTAGGWKVLQQGSCLHQPERIRGLLNAATHWLVRQLRTAQTPQRQVERTAPEVEAPGVWMRMQRLWPLLTGARRKVHHEVEWNIGVLPQPIHHLLEERPSLNVRWLPPPDLGSQRIEPFGITDGEGELNVLYAKGHKDGSWSISRVRPKQDNVLKRSRAILELAQDLHYPFTVQHDDAIYFVVVNKEQDRTWLHRLDPALDTSAPVAELWNAALHAPSLVEHAGRWWLFGCGKDLPDEGLLVFHADQLEGPYIPHALNPVRVGIDGARPGGTPFVHQGTLWRPGLDLSDPYRPHVVLHRVLALDPQVFDEVAERSIGPYRSSQYPHGTRTVAAVGGVTLVDGMRHITPLHVEQAKERAKQRRKRRSKDR
jgi:hypothetical protein